MKAMFIILCLTLSMISLLIYWPSTLTWLSQSTIVSKYMILRSAIASNSSTVPTLSITLNSSNLSNTSIVVRINRTDPSPLVNLTLTNISVISLPKNRRFAIFACSIHSSILAYTYYTPITAASWRRVGYETIVVFVGDFNKTNVLTARLNLSRTYLKHVGAHIVDVQCNESYSVKLSQLVRVFAGFLPDHIVHDDDDILTGDSDLMPLKVSEYQPTLGTNGFIFNAFCCGSFERRNKSYRMFPSKIRRFL
jgi:hypothetical protein